MMMSEMMKGGSNGNMSAMLPFMMMGGGNFEDMFDFDFDFNVDEEESEDEE